MNVRRLVPIAIGVALLALLAVGMTTVLERLAGPSPAGTTSVPATAAEPAETAHIAATLFYGSPDGAALVEMRREVPLAEGVVAQGREILRAQLEPAPDGAVSVIPEGTTLRAFYVTDRNEAFVDLSGEIARAHPGGSHTELLTVHAIVHAVTANLPAVERVQILVDGREVDTLAGHVDLRRPLSRDASLLQSQTPTP